MYFCFVDNVLYRTHKASPDRITVDYDVVYLGDGNIQV
jgi:hypothetical protein